MADSQKQVGRTLASVKTFKDLLGLEEVQRSFLEQYVASNSANKGEALLKYKKEKFLFLNRLQEMEADTKSPLRKNPDGSYPLDVKLSIYKSFLLLATSGYTLSDWHSYLIPMAGRLTWRKGANGKREEILQHPDVLAINNMPQVVYKHEVLQGDFVFQLAPPKILKHERKGIPSENDELAYVYWELLLANGKTMTYIFSRRDIEASRAFSSMPNSKAWQMTYEEMAIAKLINKVYKSFPKSSHQKFVDSLEEDLELSASTGEFDDDDYTDFQEVPTQETEKAKETPKTAHNLDIDF